MKKIKRVPWFEEGPIGDIMRERYEREQMEKEKNKGAVYYMCKTYACLAFIFSFFLLFLDSTFDLQPETLDVQLSLYSVITFVLVFFSGIILFVIGLISKWREDRTR
jgi:hypothetical protein